RVRRGSLSRARPGQETARGVSVTGSAGRLAPRPPTVECYTRWTPPHQGSGVRGLFGAPSRGVLSMSSGAARSAMIGLTAALIGVLLVASGFLIRVLVEPEAEAGGGGEATPTAVAASAEGADFGLLQEILG